jgi:hypothetical protein
MKHQWMLQARLRGDKKFLDTAHFHGEHVNCTDIKCNYVKHDDPKSRFYPDGPSRADALAEAKRFFPREEGYVGHGVVDLLNPRVYRK